MGSRGRPTKGMGKKYTRTLTSDPEIEQFLQKHPQIIASDVFRTAVRAIMPKDQDELRLKDLEVQIQEHRAALSIMEFEFNKLKDDLRRKKRLQIDTRIEADMGSWYMRSLWERGVFRKPSRLPLEEAVQRAIERGNLKRGELEKRNGQWCFTENTTEATKMQWTGLYDSEKGVLFQRPPHISISERTLKDTYFLILKPGRFQEFEQFILKEDMPAGEIPLDFFQKYEPKILSDRLKDDLRKKMLPFYDGSYDRLDLEVAP